jgi:membrane protein
MRPPSDWAWVRGARDWTLVQWARRRRWVRIAISLLRRSSLDQTRFLAGTLTFYAFVSLFPLILLVLSVAGFFVSDDARRAEIVSDIADEIPGLGPLIDRNLRALVDGRAITGLVGVLGLIYAGVDVIQAAQHALGRIFRTGEGGGTFVRRLRSYALLAALAPFALGSLVLTILVGGVRAEGIGGVTLQVLGHLAVVAADAVLILVVYRLVTPGTGPSTRDHLPGALLATAGWTLLKLLGSWYGTRVAAKATAIYGTFAVVVGVLAVLHLSSRFFLQGAELTAVLLEERSEPAPELD